jgi:hypothetical protein
MTTTNFITTNYTNAHELRKRITNGKDEVYVSTWNIGTQHFIAQK